jgi:hypothetical protein
MVTTIDQLRAYYQARADDLTLSDLDRAVAREQLDRLHGANRTRSGEYQPSRWAHVPLAELFEQAGNVVRARSNGTLQTGHEPFHDSKSGTCLVIWPDTGRWWCSSCRQSGDAATLVMALQDTSYHAAARWLAGRYGPAVSRRTPQQRGVVWRR